MAYQPFAPSDRNFHMMWMYFKRKYSGMDIATFMREMESMEAEIAALKAKTEDS